MQRFLSLVLLLAAAIPARAYPAASASKPPFTWILPDQLLISLKASPPLEKRKLTSLTLTPAEGTLWSPVGFEALMPEHKHGMNVEPSPPARSGASYEIRGVKLHMPGAWLLRLRVKHDKTGEERWLERPFLVPF